MNQRGFIDIVSLVTIIIVLGLFLGLGTMAVTVRCNPTVQRCPDLPLMPDPDAKHDKGEIP